MNAYQRQTILKFPEIIFYSYNKIMSKIVNFKGHPTVDILFIFFSKMSSNFNEGNNLNNELMLRKLIWLHYKIWISYEKIKKTLGLPLSVIMFLYLLYFSHYSASSQITRTPIFRLILKNKKLIMKNENDFIIFNHIIISTNRSYSTVG